VCLQSIFLSLSFSLVHSCARLNLQPLAYLWRRDQAELLQEMIDCQIDAIIIKVNHENEEKNAH
jgi:diphthine-ammonia ligase